MSEWTITKDKTAFIKGVAIIVVILGHCGLIECGGAIGVDLFLLVSGYGIYFSYIKSNGIQYWQRRFISVYFPYLFCTICFIVFRFLTGTSLSWQQIAISLLGQDFDLNVDPTMWYISYIFVMYLLAWGYMKLSKKNRYLGILWGGVLVFMVTACGYKYLIWHKGTIAWAYGLSFPCGLLIAEYHTTDLITN